MRDFEWPLSPSTDKIRYLFLYLYIFYLISTQKQRVTAQRLADVRID